MNANQDRKTTSHETDTFMKKQSATIVRETGQQKFERLLSLEPFTGLKAILDRLSPDREALGESFRSTESYEDLLAKLGYRLTLTKQIHVQDAFSKVGLPGGIRVVLPYYDIPTQRSLPTLINSDSTVTTTPSSAAFFNDLRAALKTQLGAKD